MTLLCSQMLLAQEAPRPRLRIGLALSGGGAKGCAHVGVLEELERLHIPIDAVTGTSMGAIVGGLYASGMPVAELKKIFVETNWDDLLNDRTGYRDLTARRKQERTQYPIEVDAGLQGRRVVFPTGVQPGQKLGLMLKQLLLPVAYERDFARLPIPFKAVATDLETGNGVVLDHGRVADAIRASMSIPGVFTPVLWGDRVLIDGGLADNLPIDLVRAMGMDVVIAVDIGQPNADRKRLQSVLAIIDQTVNFQTRNNVLPQLQHADVVLTPAVQNYGVLEFDDAATIIDAGRVEARAHEAQLARYSVDEASWKAYLDRHRQPAPPSLSVGFVRLEGNERVDARRILARTTTRAGQPLDLARLERDVRAIYAMEEFDRVDVQLTDEEGHGQGGVLLRLRERPWGPTYVHSRIEVSDALDGDAALSVGFGLTRRSLNRLGGELHADAMLGTRHGAGVELYQPLDFSRGYFVSAAVRYDRELRALFEGRARVTTYSVERGRLTLDAGRELGTFGVVRGGVSTGRVRAGVRTGTDTLPTDRHSQTGDVHASMELDTTDHAFIPRSGWRLAGTISQALPELGAESRYSQASAAALVTHSSGTMTYFAGGEVGSRLSGALPIYDQYTLGGLLSLGGYAVGQLRGDSFGVARVGTFRSLGKIAPPLGRTLYGGGLLEAGNVWPRLGDARASDLSVGVTLFLALDSAIGPFYAAISTAEGQGITPYLAIGRRF